jgi:hypothetical protein
MVAADFVRGVAMTAAALSGAACLLPATREQRHVQDAIGAMPGVAGVLVGCNDNYLAASDLCATVIMRDGLSVHFVGVGYRSFGTAASGVRVSEAGGRAPYVVSCSAGGPIIASTTADFQRGGRFGHHLTPALLDLPDAIRRHRELAIHMQYWPECPQYWEGEAADGLRYRYCAHAAGMAPVPPPRPCG